ncbi:MAG: hypothetical protein ACXWWP_04770 [Candidatus Binatia bacterium]
MSLRKNCIPTRRVVTTGVAALALNAIGASAYVAAQISLFGAEPRSLRRPLILAAWRALVHQAGIGKFHVMPLLPLCRGAWIGVVG